MEATGEKRLKRYLVWFLLLLLIVNTALVGALFCGFHAAFPTAAIKHSSKQAVARELVEYNQRLADELGVLERGAVKEALASFNYDIELFSGDELTKTILDQGRRVQEIILREADLMLVDKILALISADSQVQQDKEQLIFSLYLPEKESESDHEISTLPGDILSPATIEKIEKLIPRDRYSEGWQLEIEVADGVARQKVPYDPKEQLESLNEELDATRLKLHELRIQAGLLEMAGEGITVELYDETGATASSSIIHDTDIRDVINELFISGAKGIGVGGQRIVISSGIRCVGPLIEVNGRLIPVNPVIIQAVGEPALLASGLEIIKNNMELSRDIRFEIKREKAITLPVYSRSME